VKAKRTGLGQKVKPWKRLSTEMSIWVTSWLLRGLCATLRPVYVPQNAFGQAMADGKPFIFVTWHGRLLYLFHFERWTRGRDCTFLVSQSRDGELVSRIAERFGVEPTRGSSSRGGARGLLEMVGKVQRGYVAGVTPDGPRGPRYRVQPGVITIAQKTGAPILPLTYNARWKMVLHTWDECVIPLPFSRVVIVYGAPVDVPDGASTDMLEAKRQEVEVSLCRITNVADAYFRHRRSIQRS
jgi:lysophospholipid acyltransferase (LPLAT)-like uncharacterized protein